MAFIQKQTVPLSFQGGLQSKTDSIQLQPPNLLGLENAKFDKLGALNKRPGYDILPNQVINGNLITKASAIDSFNDELNLFDNKSIYSYLPSLQSWANRGPAISLINTNQQVVRNAASQQLNPDSTYLAGLKFFVWEDSRGSVRYSVVDATTNAYVIFDKPIAGALSKPKCIVFNNLIYIIYTSNNNLVYRTINPANANVISPQTTLQSNGLIVDLNGDNVSFSYDCCVSNNRLYIAYFGTDNEEEGMPSALLYFYLTPSNTITAFTVVAVGSAAVQNDDHIAVNIQGDSLNHVWINWSTGADVRGALYDGNPTVPTNIYNNFIIDPTAICDALCGIESVNIGAAGTLQLMYEKRNDYMFSQSNSNESTKAIILKDDSTITQVGELRSVGLASKPFVYDANIFVNLAFESTLQSTYFMALMTNEPFTLVSKVDSQVGGGLRSNHLLCEVVDMSTGAFLWANLIKGQFISENNTSFSLLGVNSTISDFTNINKFNSVTFSDNLLFVGGILQSYDGAAVSEQNFHLFPEDTFSTIINGSGALSAGQYQYQFVYAWTDKFGQIQYSSPSPTLTVTTQVNDAVRFLIPTIRLTAKTNVIIKVYRTQVNQVVFQEVTSELAPLLNDTSVDFVTFQDVVADVQMQSNQTIYTTGDVLPNTSPPSCSMISLYNDRVIIGGLEDPNLLWFSKNKVNNSNFNTIPVEFSSSLTIGVNQEGGPITAIALMDQNLIIFKRSAIFIMSGEGVNDLGTGNNFQDPQLITKNVGCANPNSLILTGQGMMFQTPDKGIWLLDRSLGPPQYIGSGVDDLAKEHIVSSAVLDPNSNSVIFTTLDGPALVYDYLISQWATWTNHQSVDAVSFENDFTFCKSNGRVYQQNQNIFYDGYVSGVAIPYEMEAITPWISFSQVLGYQSIFRTFIVGNYKGKHHLQVDVGYNFNEVFTHSTNIDATTVAGSNVWGSDSVWGQSTPWGGNNYGFAGSSAWKPYIFQVNMQIQRCTSFRIRIKDVQTNMYNEGYTLSSLLFELGSLSDGVRVPKTNTFGAAK